MAARVWRRDVIEVDSRADRGRALPGALLVGDRVERVVRHGKQLAMVGASGRVVLIHLGMTGKVVVEPGGLMSRTPHAHVGWEVERPESGRASLRFVDPRRFGGVWTLGTVGALEARWSLLGPDAGRVDAGVLTRSIGTSVRPIKAALLDQRVVAGVGNIYADESLFAAGIAPARLACSLTPEEVERLAVAVREIIALAVDAGGSTIRDYVDAEGRGGSAQFLHKVYGKGGGACVRCRGDLASGVLAQRTTVWCPRCQI